MPFQKGQVANPKGAPRRSENAALMARKHAQDAIQALVDNLKDESGQVRNTAAIHLLDRGFGKARDKVEITGEVDVIHSEITNKVLSKLTDQQLEELSLAQQPENYH